MPAEHKRLIGAVDRARAGRLLDPRRLHELGLRPRLQALAPGQEARAHAAGADRHRLGALAAARRPLGPLGEVHARPWLELLRPHRRRATAGSPTRCSSTSTPSRRTSPAPARPPPACWPTPPARSRPGSAARARPRRPRCTPSTPTSAAWPSRRPPTTRRSSPSTSARSPTAGIDLARLFDGRQDIAANIGGTPPATFGAIVRDVSGRRVLASQVGRSKVDRARDAAAADQGAARGGRAGLGARPGALRRPVHRPARHGHGEQLGGHDAASPSLHAELRSSRAGTSPAAAPAALSADMLFPSTGAAAGERRRGAQGRVAVTVGDRLIALSRVRSSRSRASTRATRSRR